MWACREVHSWFISLEHGRSFDGLGLLPPLKESSCFFPQEKKKVFKIIVHEYNCHLTHVSMDLGKLKFWDAVIIH